MPEILRLLIALSLEHGRSSMTPYSIQKNLTYFNDSLKIENKGVKIAKRNATQIREYATVTSCTKDEHFKDMQTIKSLKRSHIKTNDGANDWSQCQNNYKIYGSEVTKTKELLVGVESKTGNKFINNKK